MEQAPPLCPATSPPPVPVAPGISSTHDIKRGGRTPRTPLAQKPPTVKLSNAIPPQAQRSPIPSALLPNDQILYEDGPTSMKIPLQDNPIQSVGDPGPTCFSRSLVKHRCRRAVRAFAIVGDLFCPGRGAGAFSFFGICSPLPPATRSPSEPASQPASPVSVSFVSFGLHISRLHDAHTEGRRDLLRRWRRHCVSRPSQRDL